MSLIIMTLTWNGEDKLTKLHDSLMPALEGIDYQWFIKDNASKDNTIAVASTWGDKVKVFPYKDNQQNFSQGMNYLFAEAAPKDNDHILFLNNDIIFNDTSSIKNMINIMDKDPKVGIVGSRLLYSGTNKLQHAGVVFDPSNAAPMHFRSGTLSDNDAEKNRLFQVVTGAVLLTKAENYKNAFTKNKSGLNGMDEQYHWAFDDVDFCLSIHLNQKKKVVYCGNNNIYHEESASLKKNPANKLFMGHNMMHLFKKWGRRYMLDKTRYNLDPKHNLYLKK